jgi:hypothetical protein
MHYNAMNVELIHEPHTIRPEPELNPNWDEIEKLRWHLGCCIEYLKHYCGPVEIPKVEISVDEFNENTIGMAAVCINGSGMFVPYDRAWSYITHIFDGMRAVYNIKPGDVKFNIPVLMEYNREHVIGRSTLTRGDKTTEINIRVWEPMPIEMFEGLVAVSFAYFMPATKDFNPQNLHGL